MDLQDKFNAQCSIVDGFLKEREDLIAALNQAQIDLDTNTVDLDKAISKRDEYQAMLSIAPVRKEDRQSEKEQLMKDRQAVFVELRKLHNTWVAPQGLSILSGVDEETTASILRRAVKVEGIPVEYNGRMGRASKYRWAGEKLPK